MSGIAIHYDLMTAAEAALEALSLTDILAANIKVLTAPTSDPKYLNATPSIQVTPFGTEIEGEGENVFDDITYPIQLTILDSADLDQVTHTEKRLGWRQKIHDHFNHNRMTFSFPNASICDQRATFLPITSVPAWAANYWASGLRLDVDVRKQRRA